MGLEFQQEPVNTTSKVPVITNWTPLIGYMLYRNSGSIAALFYYKLVLEVYTGTSVVAANLIAKFLQRRNGYSVDVAANLARAFFDLRDIANTQLIETVFDQNDTGLPFRAIHKVGKNIAAKPFSVNGDNTTAKTQIIALTVKGYENYSSSANESPIDQTGDAITDTLYYLQASLPLMTARSTDSDYIQGTDFNVYNCSSNTDLFLSDIEESLSDYGLGNVRRNYVQSSDYHTVAFLNDNPNFDSDLAAMVVKYYDSSGSVLSTTGIANNSTNGGENPSGTLTDNERLLYFGCGPDNLEGQSVASGAKPSNNADWAYYTIQGMNAAASVGKTKLYYFINQDGSCKGFKVRRLAWRNSVGGYDYFNFKMKSTQTINVERNNYNSMLGTFNKSKWRYNNTQRGATTRQTTAKLQETLNTDWITEEDGNLLEKLIMSTDVYIVENADTTYTEAVMISDSSFVRKTQANDKLIKYTMKIEYANPVNTNS
jgi:hypothetical protein